MGILSGFKDLKELTREATLFPKSFNFSGFKETWDKLNFGLYYKNSFIMVIGSVICAIIFNGILAYGLAILNQRISDYKWSCNVEPLDSCNNKCSCFVCKY